MTALKKSEKFKFKLDIVNKRFNIKGIGIIDPEDAEYFISEYAKNLKIIKATEYELFFDCTELRLAGKDIQSGADMTQSLKGCLSLYKADSFKKLIFDCSKNLTMAMQLNRLGKEVGLISFEVLK